MSSQGFFFSPAHAVIEFAGPDARSFLQSQLTHDVAALDIGGWQWQGYCTAKGRLIATIALSRAAEERYLAWVHASLAGLLVKRLLMFRLRAKLAIAESATLAASFHLGQHPPALPPGGLAWAIQTEVHLAIVPREAGLPVAGTDELNTLACRRVAARQPEVMAETTERFVPQMLDWDHVPPGGGVSFSKGCYPGQEVVARAHYRGAVKKGLETHRWPADTPGIVPGATVTLADGREGEVANAAQCDGSLAALVVVQRAGAESAQS
ncbi:MAG: YgfZ/GcvT domain-containing protein [Casimicrobiaceae bacterium]